MIFFLIFGVIALTATLSAETVTRDVFGRVISTQTTSGGTTYYRDAAGRTVGQPTFTGEVPSMPPAILSRLSNGNQK